MKGPRVIGVLILGMVIVSISATTVGMVALYNTAFEQAEHRLLETVSSWARLMEAMARFDRQYSAEAVPGGAFGATLSQVKEAHAKFQGFEEIEFTLAKREDDQIVFLLNRRHYELEELQPIPFSSELAEPMRKALLGNSGTVVGLDYRGSRVLAAYEPVAELDLGIVAKIELAKLRAPFVRAAAAAFGINLLFIYLGIALFRHIGNPLMQELQESQRKLSQHAEQLEEMIEERTQELQLAHEELVHQEKLAVLGAMSGSVGHELRNPLGVISNAVYYLKTILTDPDEKIREYLGILSSEVDRAGKIISDLLNFARLESPEFQEVAVADLLDRALEREPPAEGVRITREITPNLTPAYVDSGQMEQVLVNLLSNACQAMPQGGRITIEAKEEESGVRISLTDTGCGISGENINRIFEPLFSTKTQGIGFGLSIAKSLVEGNGGSIQVKSREGAGSTFTITLPTKGGAS